jgi:peptidyl-prolyl cis-trans isomerase SurA
MKKILVFSFWTLSLSLFAQTNIIDGVIWIVGDEAILRSEVEDQRIRSQYEGVHIAGDPYCVLPEQLAIQKLFLHQAKLDSVVASDSQVEAQVNMRINYFLREIGSKEKMEEYFKKSFSDIKDEMRQNIYNQMIIQSVQQKIVGDLKLTPADVRKFYNSLSKDSIPMIPAMVEVEIIAIDPPIPPEDIERTKNQLREYADRVNKGTADFSLLARLYSDDTETAKKGGELGFMGRGELVPEFANTAFSLQEPGKVSRVVETEFGYHIIQLIERRGDRVNCRHILLRPHVAPEVKMVAMQRLDSIANIIRTGKQTFEDAALEFSMDKDTRMNGGLMTNPSTGTSKFEYQSLPQEVAKAVFNLNIGEITQPFSMINEQIGKEVYVIAKVKAKTPNHKANFTDDYQDLKTLCDERKRAEVLDHWIIEKQKETYIYIFPEWRNCEFQYKNWIK